MDIANLLFNPNGRIGPRDLWRGVILLTGFWIVSRIVSVYGGPVLGGMFSLLSLISIYCYLCVYAKRLHDGRRTGWFFLLFLLGFILLSTTIGMILTPILAPEAMKLQEEMGYVMLRDGFMAALEYAPEISRMTILPDMLGLLGANGILGYIAARLRIDPRDNEYGPAPMQAETFE